jgi:hypothetical protein
MEDASAVGRLSTELCEAAYKMRDAIKAGEDGHRGLALDVQEEVNEILLPCGWKIVRAEKFTGYR